MGAQNMVICENCICEVHFMYGKHHHLTHGPILLRPYIDITFFMTVAKCNKPFAMPGPKWQVTSFMQQQTWDVHQCLHVSIGNEKRAGKRWNVKGMGRMTYQGWEGAVLVVAAYNNPLS